MSESKAFVKEILPNVSDEIHQQSPSWMLTFLRWDKRFLFGQKEQANDLLNVREPLIVVNDCISLQVNYHKESHTPSFSAVLLGGDINYLTAIAPGDFVFINMARWESKVGELYERANKLLSINGPDDGFKGFFKIQSVRKTLGINPYTGLKTVVYQINGFAFSEFNNIIYYNQFLYTEAEKRNDLLFITKLHESWPQYFDSTKNKDNNLQDILKFLINAFIGTGGNKKGRANALQQVEQTQYYIPQGVGKLLGIPEAKTAADVYTYIFGLQTYLPSPNGTLAQNLNPINLKNVEGNFYYTDKECKGKVYLAAEMWNQVPAWGILTQHANLPLNEMYTSFRVSPEGSIMPTLVFRQTPMTSERFKLEYPVTRFLNLPRWKVSPYLIYDINIGRDDVGRINFVQMFGSAPSLPSESNQAFLAQQIARGNYEVDILDIKRSGLRPIIKTNNFDYFTTGKVGLQSPIWAKILGDALIGGHLKLNGHIGCVGIEEPIAVGDNLEFDGTVFHIEAITHTCSVNPNGIKTFRSHIEISHGVNLASDSNGKVFSEMEHTDAQRNQERDFERERVMPGLTDEQAIPSRIEGRKFGVNNTIEEPFVSNVKSKTGDPKPIKTNNKKRKK
jgi:hypothetical protein